MHPDLVLIVRELMAETIRRRLQKPIRSKLARLARTREKVVLEASRQGDAEDHRRMGEVLSQNLHRIPRGSTIAALVEYTAEGPMPVEIPIRPGRSPKDQAEWHFQKYRRLLRGCERAAVRLQELARDQADTERALQRLQASLVADLLRHSRVLNAPAKRAVPVSRPYKEYWSEDGQRILVGRNAASNEVLTFRIGQPHHLWLHARSASGSHVLVPLGKREPISSEVLLDAAHLALHHSSLKGEPRGEVTYTQAKYLRRMKGQPPGTVEVTRERTLMVKVEPQRLRRLLDSRSQGQSATRAGGEGP